MAVSAMRWWSDRALGQVAARLGQAVDAWRTAWGCAAPASVECVREHEWKGAARYRSAPALRASVFDALFGPRPVSSTGDELAADRLADVAASELQETLRAASLLPSLAIDDGAAAPRARPWSGVVIAAISCAGIRVVLRLEPAGVAAMLAAEGRPQGRAPREDAPPLATLADALYARTVRVRTTLAAGDLDIGSLQALALGDVIRLPHSLDQPLAVQAGGSTLPCGAYLGQRNGRRAIELARHAAHFDSGEAR